VKEGCLSTIGFKTLVRLLALVCLILLPGCNSLTGHKILTTIFDGVPSLPEPEQLCKEYVETQKNLTAEQLLKGTKAADADLQRSEHPPYAEKRCDDCHDKQKEGGLIAPPTELCFTCHTNFIKGYFVHGPVAVGQCLSCHVPHNSNYPSLLKVGKKDLCGSCHREGRVAASLHQKAKEKNFNCTDCHSPHFGNAPYFIK
jgi:predicted CXXCH cytochrome family protein